MFNLSELSQKLKSEKSVALFCHARPDGDAIGSALALSLALKTLGIKADVYCDDQIPSRFFFLNVCDDIKQTLTENYSALVAIDCGDINRLGSFALTFKSHKNTYNIDHHISNIGYAKYNYVADMPSNSENVFELINVMGVEITEQMANLLALGIMTDTGNLRHNSVIPKTFYTMGKLKELGADITKIYFYMFSAQTKERAKLFGLVMEKIRYFHNDRCAVASIRLSDLEKSGAKQDETEGFIDFVMGIIGVEVGACVLEMKNNKFKISFRSKSANVNAVAGVFGGGGHTMASGCQIQGEYEEVIDKITFAIGRELKD